MTEDKNILVIDDEAAIRRSFELALEDSEYQVTTVDSGEKGVEEVKNKAYQLIFLDLKMPGMNGVETLYAIRKLYPRVPIYIVTAFHKEFLTDLEGARSQNIQFQLLRKPIGNVEILAVVSSVLGNPVNFG